MPNTSNMLTVLMEYKGEVIYLEPFEDHGEAINRFCELYPYKMGEVYLTISSETIIPLKEKGYIPLSYIR